MDHETFGSPKDALDSRGGALPSPFPAFPVPLGEGGIRRGHGADWPGYTGILPNQADAITIGLIDEHCFSRECIRACLHNLRQDLAVLAFASPGESLSAAPDRLDLLVYHRHVSRRRDPDGSIAALRRGFEGVPLVIVSDDDDSETVMEALKGGACGYIPTRTTSIDVAVAILRLVRAGGTFAPSTNLPAREGTGGVPPAKSVIETCLTPRQMAVLQHLQQGKANKIIAHELAMSESTVKVHVRNIMKKMGATNRTQVAFRARNLSAPGLQASAQGR